MSRPIKWTDDKIKDAAEKIMARIQEGESASAILKNGADREHYPSYSVFTKWLLEVPGLNDQYARACEKRADVIFEEILAIADKQDKDVIKVDGKDVINHNVINRNRLQVDARKWMLGKMQPKKYGDRLEIEHVNEMSEEARLIRIAELRDKLKDNPE